MAYDKNSKAWTNKYRSKQEFIQVRVSAEEKARIQEHANRRGESMSAYMVRATEEKMKREDSRSPKKDD